MRPPSASISGRDMEGIHRASAGKEKGMDAARFVTIRNCHRSRPDAPRIRSDRRSRAELCSKIAGAFPAGRHGLCLLRTYRQSVQAVLVRSCASTGEPVLTHTRRRCFCGPVADVLCRRPLADFVEQCRVRWKQPFPDHCRRFGRTTAERPHLKSATVRDRPFAAEPVAHQKSMAAMQ